MTATAVRHKKANPSKVSKPGFKKFAKEFLKQKVAVLCTRYQYRGILAAVGKDSIVLDKARAVEISGKSTNGIPDTEDEIGSSLVIMNGTIELLYQPDWCFAPLKGE
jgi:hypothetical protein